MSNLINGKPKWFFSGSEVFYYLWDNYSKLTYGMVRFYFAYLWVNHLHFVHLNFNPFALGYPPHP